MNQQTSTAQGRKFDRGTLVTLGIVYLLAVVMMFSGGYGGLVDTIGLLISLVEALIVLGLDKPGLASMRGLINRETLSSGARLALTIGEVIFFPLTLGVYLVRALIEARDELGFTPPSQQ
ncbi:MAG TPA: hypothetical protein VMV29_20850 [Ktedonobacterales bacterium]|nr:hypothetical protein [Ktedonobacterales bacterium]